MDRLRSFGDVLAGGLGLILGMAFFVVTTGLFVGGIVYRKDCVNRETKVEKNWTVQWVVVLPYLLRPSEEGCLVHTGTRVALDAVGIAPIKEDTAAEIVRKATDDSSITDEGTAYYAGLFAELDDLRRDSADAATIRAGQRAVQDTRDGIAGLSPPPYVESDHALLISTLDSVLVLTDRGIQAFESGDAAELQRVSRRISVLEEQFFATGERIRRTVIQRRIGD